eukprot:scaffold565_cov143-Skeletonema_menzelii.AAC.2
MRYHRKGKSGGSGSDLTDERNRTPVLLIFRISEPALILVERSKKTPGASSVARAKAGDH